MNNSNHNQSLYPTGIDLPSEIRLYVISLLNRTLSCTVDLRSQVKQAGWNVRGSDFSPLQVLFATMASELEGYADLVAERIGILGGVAMGTSRTAAMQSTLPEYPASIVDGTAHVGALRGLCHGDAGRHCACCRCRGCGQCCGLHRYLARGRQTALGLGSTPLPLSSTASTLPQPDEESGMRNTASVM